MARWPLPITLLAMSATAAVVTSPGGAAPAPSPSVSEQTEAFQVPPGLTPGSRVASETLFKPGHSYKINVSGTVTAKSDTQTLVFSAFHCLQGCPGSADHAYAPHLRIYNKADGTALAPGNLNKDSKYEDAIYNSEGKYTLTFDNFARDTRLEWSAEPHGTNPDAYGRYYSGAGFRVEIKPDPRIVSFKFKQAGLPQRPPQEMISSQLGAKGSVLLPDIDLSKPGYVNADPRGAAAYVAINEGKDHLVSFRLVEGQYKQRDSVREVVLALKVRKSNVPGCGEGRRAVLRLMDATEKSDDEVRLASRPCDYTLAWTRRTSDEFHLSVSKPQ